MAEGGSGSVDILLSMGIVRKRVQGNCFVTIGGASIIKYPSSQKESPPDPSQNAASVEQKNYKTVVATTSEVVSKADLTSSTPWRVEFLPDKWYKRNTEKFSLVGVEFMEMHLSNGASSLTLFPTESLYKETWFPQFISGNDWASNRSQSCYQAQRKTKVKDTKIEFICYVLVADDTTGKFHVACYVLSADERGSYYLHPHGNKAKLKKLDDFQPTERPKGSVILNEDGYVVGFLAFSDTDEIHPLFLPDYLQDNDVPRQALSTEATHNPEDHNQNKTDENHMLQVTIIDKQIVGSQNEPRDMSYTSHNRDLLKKSLSEQLTPRAQRRLFNCQSVLEPIPLNEETLVGKTILEGRVFIKDKLSYSLDTSFKRVQNWRHLAELNEVSTDQSQERLSKSEALFEVVVSRNPNLLIGDVKALLSNLKMIEVRNYLKRHDDKIKIKDFLQSQDPIILSEVFLKLDHLPDSKWQSLGLKLGMEHDDLQQIKIDCANQNENPAHELIEYIYRREPTMTMGRFKKHLTNIQRNDVKDKLDSMKDTLTIKDLFDDLDLMRVITSMLNGPDDSPIKNYKYLASECQVSSDLYQSLQPPCPESPTALVLEEIVSQRPTFTMEQLLANLRDMDRVDAIQGISSYFVEEDIRAMKRKLRIE
ncbi:unnamed protein product [Pocillopora meandrina]|uniref:Death domain-containing protein n=1 Tax=Pocillopora meandrina TaxID=46732 RepID=A0AAU9VTZ5_9CNID|nr:unnamed protein product [Pocillopora meandrina]